MSSEATLYQCPTCSGRLEYAPGSNLWNCPYCRNSFSRAELGTYGSEADGFSAGTQDPVKGREAVVASPCLEFSFDRSYEDSLNRSRISWSHEEEGHLHTHHCPACGAMLLGDLGQISLRCPYCHNNAVLQENIKGAYRPQLIIPFRIERDRAESIIRANINAADLPPAFSKAVNFRDLTGIYVPFWLFECSIDYYATGTAYESYDYDRNQPQRPLRQKLAFRYAGTVGFENIPLDGSIKIDDNLVGSLCPFDWNSLIPFDLAYFAGFVADAYDQPATELIPRALNYLDNATRAAVQMQIPHINPRFEHEDSQVKSISARLCYIPFWLLSVDFEGKSYQYAVSGDYGRFSGSFPAPRRSSLYEKVKRIGLGYIIGFVLLLVLNILFFTYIKGDFSTIMATASALNFLPAIIFYTRYHKLKRVLPPPKPQGLKSVLSYLRSRSCIERQNDVIAITENQTVDWDLID